MCTVLFIPFQDRFYFASLRDEDPFRGQAHTPQITEGENYRFLAPADPKAGGTWAGISNYGNVLILLNGGFKKHVHAGPYRKSRGIIVQELLKSVYPVAEWSVMDLEGIEPFTLITWCEQHLYELVWDGQDKHRVLLDPHQPAIWSSSTLYDEQAKEIRQSLFKQWTRSHPVIDAATIMSFFQSFTDKENGFLMNRSEKLKTLSYSFIEYRPSGEALYYYDDFTTLLPQIQFMKTTSYKPDFSVLFPHTLAATINK